MELFLQHTPQPYPWGCQYYSLYSLVGDERLLEDVTECNAMRFDERARALGYLLAYVYCESTCTVPMPEAVWRQLFGDSAGWECLQGKVGAFLIDVQSPRHRHVMHTVGIALRAIGEADILVQVFDPSAAGEKEFCTLADFLASPYGQVYSLKQVLAVAELADGLPCCFGPDAAHVSAAVRQAWEATLTPHAPQA